MAAIFNGPARGGNRGGKDQFNWEDVKEDKYNQNYLGHSVKAPIGRWQKGAIPESALTVRVFVNFCIA